MKIFIKGLIRLVALVIIGVGLYQFFTMDLAFGSPWEEIVGKEGVQGVLIGVVGYVIANPIAAVVYAIVNFFLAFIELGE